MNKRQTRLEREALKEILKAKLGANDEVYKTIEIMDDTTTVRDKISGKTFTCVELQLKGCLIENGLRRRYVSYADLNTYEVTN